MGKWDSFKVTKTKITNTTADAPDAKSIQKKAYTDTSNSAPKPGVFVGGSPAGISNHQHSSGIYPNVYPSPQPIVAQPYNPNVYIQTTPTVEEPGDARMDKLADRLGVEPKKASDPTQGLHIKGENGYYGVVDLFVAMGEFMDRFRLCPGCGEPGEIAAGDYLCTACRG